VATNYKAMTDSDLGVAFALVLEQLQARDGRAMELALESCELDCLEQLEKDVGEYIAEQDSEDEDEEDGDD
jgi:hypothetical protein